MYPSFAKKAREEGFEEIAELLSGSWALSDNTFCIRDDKRANITGSVVIGGVICTECMRMKIS